MFIIFNLCKINFKISLKKYNLIINHKKLIYAVTSIAATILFILYFYFLQLNSHVNINSKIIAQNKINHSNVQPIKKTKDILYQKNNKNTINNEINNTEKQNNADYKIKVFLSQKTQNIKNIVDNNIKSENTHHENSKIDLIEPKSIKRIANRSFDTYISNECLKKFVYSVNNFKQQKKELEISSIIGKNQIAEIPVNRLAVADLNKNKLTFGKMAVILVKSIGKLTNNKTKLENTYNSKEKSVILALYNDKVAIIKIIRNK